jgi:glyoxylase-like metal-dependent hydrolase (beta-lactamase superfamily II)/8-oxo-dGTP pyrophosphatase MutT (NUDIX family)
MAIKIVPPAERTPPRAAATIVLLRPGAGATEILLMRRSQKAANFSGAFVFPGGLLEPADREPRLLDRVVGIPEPEANARLEVPAGALSYWAAAVRECYEESGILLAVDEQQRPLSADRLAALAPLRTALNAGQTTLLEILERERLYIPAQVIAYADRWITPPVHARRFDTRFFVAAVPVGQQVWHDNAELVESHWLTRAEVLRRFEAGQMELPLPTQVLVKRLGAHDHPGAAVAAVQSVRRVPVNHVCVAQGRDGARLFNRADAPYAEIHWSDPDETGTSSYDLLPDVPKQLDPHVARVLAPNASYMTGPGTNAYLVGGRELAVIDPGPDDAAHIAALAQAGGGCIRWILLTHTHSDHAPAANALRAATGAQLAGIPAPAGSAHNVELRFDRQLKDGDTIELGGCTLRAIHTPGHASNHLCYLLEDSGMLFSGDHVIQGFTAVIAPPDGNMSDFLASLCRLAAMEIAILAPGHGYLIGDPTDEITRLIAHRLAREAKVRDALRRSGGHATLAALLALVYDDVPVAIHAMAELSLRAHLQKLVRDGELVEHGAAWSWAAGAAGATS